MTNDALKYYRKTMRKFVGMATAILFGIYMLIVAISLGAGLMLRWLVIAVGLVSAKSPLSVAPIFVAVGIFIMSMGFSSMLEENVCRYIFQANHDEIMGALNCLKNISAIKSVPVVEVSGFGSSMDCSTYFSGDMLAIWNDVNSRSDINSDDTEVVCAR